MSFLGALGMSLDNDLINAITRAVAQDDERQARRLKESPLGRWELLTEREKDIVRDVAMMLSNKSIGEKRGISERTVETHRASALKKLGLHKPADIAKMLKQLRS